MQVIHRAALDGSTVCGIPGKVSVSGACVTCPDCNPKPKTRYLNPWHKPGQVDTYGPYMYETEAKGIPVGPYMVYERIKGVCWDWVKNGVCITQRAGFNGKIPENDERLKA